MTGVQTCALPIWQASGIVPRREGAIGVHVGEPHEGVGDHGDVVGGHEGDVVGRAPQGEGVIHVGREVQRVVVGVARAHLVGLVHLQGQALVDGGGVAHVVAVALVLRAGLVEAVLAAAYFPYSCLEECLQCFQNGGINSGQFGLFSLLFTPSLA